MARWNHSCSISSIRDITKKGKLRNTSREKCTHRSRRHNHLGISSRRTKPNYVQLTRWRRWYRKLLGRGIQSMRHNQCDDRSNRRDIHNSMSEPRNKRNHHHRRFCFNWKLICSRRMSCRNCERIRTTRKDICTGEIPK